MKPRTSKRRRSLRLLLALGVIAAAIVLVRFAIGEFYRLSYPLKYEGIIETYSQENGLPLSLVYAVVHTESSFTPDAVSKVDARGLMQITRDTFEWAEHKMKAAQNLDYDEYAFDPETNVRYGTFLLRVLYDEFGSYDVALCAYHAGRGSVKGWLKDPEFSSDGVHVDNIPFKDTRWYVARVNETREIYQRLYDMQ